jgi:predicted hydrocarbon binding protein
LVIKKKRGDKNMRKAKNLRNALVIGIMRGMKKNLGKGLQGFANMIGFYGGVEMIKYVKDQGENFQSMQDVTEFFRKNDFAQTVELEKQGKTYNITIEGCEICPKKIGGYEFEGTACPLPGFFVGAMKEALNEEFRTAARLTPGEICIITLYQY